MLANKKIVLITASHLSSCPRLLKEAELLYQNNCNVHIIFLSSLSFMKQADDAIMKSNPNWNFHPIYWNNSLSDRITALFSKLSYHISNLFKTNSDFIQSTSQVLINKTLSIKADFYIAHHPSVLVAAAKASEKHNAKFSYDIEDAFPYLEDGSFEKNPNKSIIQVESKYINKASLITSASPLYTILYQQLYLLNTDPIVLLNVFKLNEQKIKEYKDRKDLNKLSLYWYSQTVGLNRGLQDLFQALNYLNPEQVELHIRGRCDDNIKEYLLSLLKHKEMLPSIYFHDLVTNDELIFRNQEHDIGFALENVISLNKDLCISNKILDYLRSGLAVIASDTKGHRYVLAESGMPELIYTARDIKTLSLIITNFINDRLLVEVYKQKSLKIAKEKFNWEIQSQKWIINLNSIIK